MILKELKSEIKLESRHALIDSNFVSFKNEWKTTRVDHELEMFISNAWTNWQSYGGIWYYKAFYKVNAKPIGTIEIFCLRMYLFISCGETSIYNNWNDFNRLLYTIQPVNYLYKFPNHLFVYNVWLLAQLLFKFRWKNFLN